MGCLHCTMGIYQHAKYSRGIGIQPGRGRFENYQPQARNDETGDFGELALIGHEAEVHFHSFEPASDTANPKNVVSELKERYGEWRGDMSKLWQKILMLFKGGF